MLLHANQQAAMTLYKRIVATESKRVEREKRKEKLSRENTPPLCFWNLVLWLRFLALCSFPYTPLLLPHIPPSLPLNLSEVLITDEGWCATGSSHAIQLPVGASGWPRCCHGQKKKQVRGKMRSEREGKTGKESKKKNLTLVSSWQHALGGTHAIHFTCCLEDY